jgi:hypothetical protein
MAAEPDPEAKTSDAKKTNGAAATEIMTVTLRKPIMAHGDEISELKFREPTAGDIEKCGNPVNLDFQGDSPKMTFDSKAMSAMMSLLAAVPPSTIRQMHPRDWNSAAWNLASFFMPDL